MYVCVYVYAYFFPQNNFPDMPNQYLLIWLANLYNFYNTITVSPS